MFYSNHLAKPKLIQMPSSHNCLNQCDLHSYNVSCTIDPDLVHQWTTNYGITVSIHWVIQNRWILTQLNSLPGLADYFSTDSSGVSANGRNFFFDFVILVVTKLLIICLCLEFVLDCIGWILMSVQICK